MAPRRTPPPETTVVGHRWSSRSFEVRDLLARNRIPYRWYAVTDPEGDQLLTAARVPPEEGESAIPVVVTAEGEALRRPTDAELAQRVGLSVDPAEDFYDVVVVGGGPAGLGAAVYAASEGLRTVLAERTAPGGQAGTSSRIEDYLGLRASTWTGWTWSPTRHRRTR